MQISPKRGKHFYDVVVDGNAIDVFQKTFFDYFLKVTHKLKFESIKENLDLLKYLRHQAAV